MKKLLAYSLTALLIAIGFPYAASAAEAAFAAPGSAAFAQKRGKRTRVKQQRQRRGNDVRRQGRVDRNVNRDRIRQTQRIRNQRQRSEVGRRQNARIERARRERSRAQRTKDRRIWIEPSRKMRVRDQRIRRDRIERDRQIRRIREREDEFRRVRRDRDYDRRRYERYRYRDDDRFRRIRRDRSRDLRLRDLWFEREAVRFYGHPGRGWGVRAKQARAYRDFVVARRIARPIYIVERPYYADYYDPYGYYAYPYDRYYGRNNGFEFRIGSRSGDFFFSIGSFDRNPHIYIPYTPYDRYAYVAPAYRRSQTFRVDIAGAPVSYTRYEEVNYAPVYADYGYAPVYADRGYYYDPWYEGDRYAIDPYADACYTDLGYPDDVYYDDPVYYSNASFSFYDRRDGRSFYRRHRNLVNIGLATGAGAAIGAIFGGKRGAIIGAGVGAGAGAVYTYGIDPKDDRRYGT